MSVVVVVLLAVLWAWILVPEAVRERRATSPASTISRFERSMAQLARARPVKAVRSLPGHDGSGSGVWVLEEAATNDGAAVRAARRRRQVLTALTATTTAMLIAAQVLGGFAWFVFWLAAVLLGAYLVLLAHRWVRISQDAALPLVRPSARERPGPLEDTDGVRSAGTQMREVAEFKLEKDAVNVVEW